MAFNTRNRGFKPWERLEQRTAVDGSNVLVDAPRTRSTSPSAYGRECERTAFKALKADGWSPTWSHLSRGAADISATKNVGDGEAITRLIQVKATLSFYPTFLNAGLREIMTAPRVRSREVWGYVKGHGLAVRITVGGDDLPHVTGKEPFRGDVAAALTRMRSQPNDHAAQPANGGSG